MSDDLDKAIDLLTMPQRMILAQTLSLAMSVDSAKRAASAKPGEVAFSKPLTLGEQFDAQAFADLVNRRASPGREGEP